MVAVPAVMPVTLPVEPTVAILVEPELHIPPPEASVKFIIDPAHTVIRPFIIPASGNGLTVIISVALKVPQLLLTVYDIVAVPAVMPVRLPVEPTVAMLVEPELHIPPPEPSVTLVIDPAHTLKRPVIVPVSGNGLTVTMAIALAPLHAIGTV